MLIVKAEIVFFKLNEEGVDEGGINAKIALRPAFSFGDDLLFSGIIENDSNTKTYLVERKYVVKVEFPTIEDEAYEAIEPLLESEKIIDIQNRSRKIGEAKLFEYQYLS